MNCMEQLRVAFSLLYLHHNNHDYIVVINVSYPAASSSEVHGLRPSVLGQDRSETKKSVLVLVLPVIC